MREILDRCDVEALQALLEAEPELARTQMTGYRDHPRGVEPLAYVAMLHFDAPRLGLTGISRTDEMARVLLAAGAPVEGMPPSRETPLMTAASYGDADVAQVLVDAGADLDARAADDAGGVPGGTALLHAAVFGMTDVVDVLVRAGATVDGIEVAAAAGDVSGWLTPDTEPQAKLRALVMAADHERLDVISELVAAGTPIDDADEAWGRQAMQVAVENGRAASIERLLELGAEPH